MEPWRSWSMAAVAMAAVMLAVATLELAGRGGPISSLVLSTGLGPDGRPLPPLLPPRPIMCTGPACGQVDVGTRTMMENIKKVLHALDSRLGNVMTPSMTGRAQWRTK